jgi:hypothetical protein
MQMYALSEHGQESVSGQIYPCTPPSPPHPLAGFPTGGGVAADIVPERPGPGQAGAEPASHGGGLL